VSRALRLEFNELKRAAESGGRKQEKKGVTRTPAFVELIAPRTTAGRACVIEVEGRRGKLRIELQGTAAAELAGISRALWEMVS
jgi:hypothetical protein